VTYASRRWTNCVLWRAAVLCVACQSEDSSVPKLPAEQQARHTPESIPPTAQVRESLAVERSGVLEQCTEISSAPDATLGLAARRAILYRHVESPKERVTVASGACSEAFRLRRALATCVVPASNTGTEGVEITHRYYLLSACKTDSAAERQCRKAGGTWTVANLEEPAVAGERLRQSTKGLFDSLQKAIQR
jgi:hypothetical protein